MNNELILTGRRNISLSFFMALLYSVAIKIVTLLQTRYAALLYATAKAAIEKKEQNKIDARNRVLFVPASSTSYKDDDASIHSADSVDSNASFCEQLNNTSLHMWITPECRSTQLVDVKTILFDARCKGKLLVVDQSGGVKSHILHMIATIPGGSFSS